MSSTRPGDYVPADFAAYTRLAEDMIESATKEELSDVSADARTFCLPEMSGQTEDLQRRASRKTALAAIC